MGFKFLVPEHEYERCFIGGNAPTVSIAGEPYRLLEATVAARGGDAISEDVAVLVFEEPMFADHVINEFAPTVSAVGSERLIASGFGIWKSEDLVIDEAAGRFVWTPGAATSRVPRSVEIEGLRNRRAPGLILTPVGSKEHGQTAPADSGGSVTTAEGFLVGTVQGAMTGRSQDGEIVHVLVAVDIRAEGLKPLWRRAVENGAPASVFKILY